MSSFKEEMTKMGYEIVKREDDVLLIKKYDELATIYVLFHFTGKDITGAMRTNRPIFNLDEISHHYKLFRDMQADLKVFKQLTGYDIID